MLHKNGWHIHIRQLQNLGQQNKLVVHPYTVRSDKLPEYTPDVNQLYDALYNKAGVNGLFTDFPDKAVKFLNKE